MIDVTAIGELLIDFAAVSADCHGYPTMVSHPGGAPGNFLAALTAYGMKTAFIGKVGNDFFGNKLIETMKGAGIETRGIVKAEDVYTTLAFVTFDETGDRSFSFSRKPGADTCLEFSEVNMELIDNSKVFHFGTLSLTDDPAKTATQRCVNYAKDKGKIITFDPNLRMSLWRDKQEAAREMLWGLYKADIVKISDEEVEFLFDCNEEEGAKKLLDEFGVKLAMVTMGNRGCYLKNPSESVFVKSPAVKVKDTTGAGDIFGGSALSRILKMGKNPEMLNKDDLRSIAEFACTAASLSTQVSGGIPSIPSEAAVLSRMCR